MERYDGVLDVLLDPIGCLLFSKLHQALVFFADQRLPGRRSGQLRARTEPLTGYILGGATDLACKKEYYTVFIDETVILLDVISISAGMRGLQVLLVRTTTSG